MSDADDAATVAEPAPPPVVVVVVTSDPGPWFEDTLRALAQQDYPNLSVLIIDDGSAEDPTARVAAVLPTAFLRRLPQRVGFSAAANEVLRLVQGASHFVFCHDDVAPEPDAIRLLVEEAFRSNAGVVAPKLVMWDEPDRLLQVGLAVDKSGAPAALNERGELDQEQHDAVRDVFVAPGGCTVVRADLFAAIGGYDAAMVAMGEDLDLSWRVQVAGARVVVAPAARVRHLEATFTGRRALQLPEGTGIPPGSQAVTLRRLELRHRLRTLYKCYSRFHLLRVLPQIAVLALAEVVYGIATNRRDVSRAIAAAWGWTLRNRSELKAARAQVQATRSLPDHDVRRLQVRGSSRFAGFVRGQLGGEGGNVFATASREIAGSLSGPTLKLALSVWLPLLAILAFGSRNLLGERLPTIGQIVPFPEDATTFLRHYAAGWRTAGLGSESPAPAAFGVFGLLGLVLLGGMGLLQKLVVLGALPVGILGAYRLVGRAGSLRSRLAAVIVYAGNPLFYDSLAAGRWDAIVLYGAAPWLLQRLVRSTSEAPFATTRRPLVAHGVALGLLLALVSAVVPSAPLVVLVVALLLAVGGLLTSGGLRTFRAVGVAAVATATTVVLLFPWSLELLLPGTEWSALTGIAPEASRGLSFADLARFDLGRVGGGPFGVALLVAAALPLLVGRGWRLAWAGRLWLVALGCWGLAWASGRGWVPFPLPQPGVLLAPAAASLALSTALGMSAFELDLPGYRFGWRQVASSAAALAALVATLPVAAASLDGRWNTPARDVGQLLSWMDDDPAAGDFRVLWLGDPEVLPIEGWELEPGVAYATSRNGTPTAVDLWPGSSQGATRLIDGALRIVRDGDSSRLGHLLAPMSIRYIVVVEQAAPQQEATPVRRVPPALVHALRSQVDLRIRDVDPAIQVFENAQWAPLRSVFPSRDAAQASREAGPAAARAADLTGAAPVLPDRRGAVRFEGALPPESEVLVSEAASARWELEVDGVAAERRRAFGWANAYEVPDGGPARLRYATSPLRYFAIAIQAALWVAAVRFVRRRRAVAVGPSAAVPAVARAVPRAEPATSSAEPMLTFERSESSDTLLDDLAWTDEDELDQPAVDDDGAVGVDDLPLDEPESLLPGSAGASHVDDEERTDAAAADPPDDDGDGDGDGDTDLFAGGDGWDDDEGDEQQVALSGRRRPPTPAERRAAAQTPVVPDPFDDEESW